MSNRPPYPRCRAGEHQSIAAMDCSGEVVVRGRVISADGRQGVLADETGRLGFCGRVDQAWKGGDLVEVRGSVDGDGQLKARILRVLAPSLHPLGDGDWQRLNENGGMIAANLRTRARVLSLIRSHFEERNFTEVETPHLLSFRGCEVHIDQFETRYVAGKKSNSLFLAPSPELHMKRLLGAGMERIYQLGRSYRNGEISPLHNPEFTMLEWYRAYASYEDLMAQAQELVIEVLLAASAQPQQWDSLAAAAPWPRLCVGEAFMRWGGIDLARHAEAGSLLEEMRRLGYASAQPGDSWDDLFHKVLIERVEPEIARMGAVFLIDYPAQLGAMAKLKGDDPAWAERAELYIGGIELANGYSELNDPEEQRRRFVQARSSQGAEPIDEAFLTAMECGFPPAGGMALGVDRLVMLAANAQRIDQVLAFPMQD